MRVSQVKAIINIPQNMKNPTKNNTPQTPTLSQLPFMYRLIFTILILTHIINLTTGQWIQNNLILNIQSIFTKYQIWRILTFWIYQPSILTIIIMLINSMDLLVKFEKRNSSTVLLNDLFINLLFFGFVFVGGQFVFSFVLGYYPSYTFTIVYMWMNMLFKYAYYNSEQNVSLCCFKNNVKIMYYPFIMFVIVCVVNFGVRLDAMMALILGIIQCRFFKGGLILFAKDSYDDKQKAVDWIGFSKFSCWYSLNQNHIKLNQRWTVSSSQFYIDLVTYQGQTMISQQQSTDNPSSQVFQGTGVVIGGEQIEIMK